MNDILHRQFRCRLRCVICFTAVVLTFCGCGQSGPKYWPVSGKVTFRGKSVTAASVRYSNPLVGVDVVAELDADGKYVVTGMKTGLPEGTYQVAVIPKLNYDNVKSTPGGLVDPSTVPSMDRPDIPKRYHQPATSGLTLTVKREPNAFNVDMQ